MKYKIPSLFILLTLLASCSPATDPNKDTFDCYYETYNITVNLKNNDNYQKLSKTLINQLINIGNY